MVMAQAAHTRHGPWWPRVIAGIVTLLGMSGFASLGHAQAKIGAPALPFALIDATGQRRALADFHGKFVVLEWFNNDCPFVGKHYGSGNMQRLQATYAAKGVAWLTIISSAPGKQGHVSLEEARAIIAKRKARQTALLLDSDGAVGRLYGAKTTPHMFIIDPQGRVIYAGAIDDHPSTNPDDVPQATNYVQRALDEALNGHPVSMPETTSYGCSVKY